MSTHTPQPEDVVLTPGSLVAALAELDDAQLQRWGQARARRYRVEPDAFSRYKLTTLVSAANRELTRRDLPAVGL